MRILLAQNLIPLPTFGGANKANRLLMAELAARGHTCRVVAPMAGGNWRPPRAGYPVFLAERGLPVLEATSEHVVYTDSGVRVHAVAEASRLPGEVVRVGRRFDPDVVLVPMDDPAQVVLNAAFEAVGPARVVCVAHTLDLLPFGPSSRTPSEAGTRQMRRARGVLTVSELAVDYLRRWAGIDATLLRLPVYGRGPFPHHDGHAVTMINPSREKGIDTFLHLADALPDTDFLAVPTWATTPDDHRALAARPNIALAEPVEDIDTILARTRVLVMPSTWVETFGMSAVEAMLRGIPVVASAIGGLPEAMLGVPHLLPPDAPATWLPVVHRLLTDAAHHRTIATQARTAATAFLESARVDRVEHYLHTSATHPGPSPTPRASTLTPARRDLLTRLLARQST